MNRYTFLITSVAICFACDTALAQTPGQLRRDRLRGTLDIQDAEIAEQRVQRQTEIMRLEGILDDFGDRMERMERQMLSMSQLPAITIAEAEAALQYAQIQLKDSEQRHAEGELTDLALARHRLELARAKGQLDTAKVAHADRLILLELDVLYAQRQLMELNQQQRQLERLVAKGYSSSEGLKRRAYDIAMTEKQLARAQLRLTAEKKAAGDQPPEQLLDAPAASESTN